MKFKQIISRILVSTLFMIISSSLIASDQSSSSSTSSSSSSGRATTEWEKKWESIGLTKIIPDSFISRFGNRSYTLSDLKKDLDKNPEYINATTIAGEELLFIALDRNKHLDQRSADFVEELIKRGANVNPKNIIGQTPLLVETYNILTGRSKSLEIISQLIKAGADLYATDTIGDTDGLTAYGIAVERYKEDPIDQNVIKLISLLAKHMANNPKPKTNDVREKLNSIAKE